jgi:hypothetical protein
MYLPRTFNSGTNHYLKVLLTDLNSEFTLQRRERPNDVILRCLDTVATFFAFVDPIFMSGIANPDPVTYVGYSETEAFETAKHSYIF